MEMRPLVRDGRTICLVTVFMVAHTPKEGPVVATRVVVRGIQRPVVHRRVHWAVIRPVVPRHRCTNPLLILGIPHPLSREGARCRLGCFCCRLRGARLPVRLWNRHTARSEYCDKKSNCAFHDVPFVVWPSRNRRFCILLYYHSSHFVKSSR